MESRNGNLKMLLLQPDLIKFLDTIRPMLEKVSPVLGVTDPVSGPVVAER